MFTVKQKPPPPPTLEDNIAAAVAVQQDVAVAATPESDPTVEEIPFKVGTFTFVTKKTKHIPKFKIIVCFILNF